LSRNTATGRSMFTKMAAIHVEKAIHSSATSVTLKVKGRKANPSATLSIRSVNPTCSLYR
jgi:hypothetical protein